MKLYSELNKSFEKMNELSKSARKELDLLLGKQEQARELRKKDVITVTECNRREQEASEAMKPIRERFAGDMDGVKRRWRQAYASLTMLNSVELSKITPVLDSIDLTHDELHQMIADHLDDYTSLRCLASYAKRHDLDDAGVLSATLDAYLKDANKAFESLCEWNSSLIASNDSPDDQQAHRAFCKQGLTELMIRAKESEDRFHATITKGHEPAFNLDVALAEARA